MIILMFLIPGLSLRSNPGLKLENAFGVFIQNQRTPSAYAAESANAFGVFDQN